MGRHKSKEPIRNIQYRLRITPEEHLYLKDLSESFGLPISDLIRHGVLGIREDAIHRGIISARRNGKTYDKERLRDALRRCQGQREWPNKNPNVGKK